MLNYLKNIRKSELFLGSLILLVLTNIGNVLSYLFQFIMARMLGPADYGVLAVLTSIVAIFGIPTLSIQTVIAKNTTRFNVKKDFGKIKGLFEYSIKRTLIISIFSFMFFILISFILSAYLNISFWLLALTGIFIFGAFLYPVSAGVLQGMKKFKELGVSFVLNCFVKLLVGVIFVLVGFKVYGAVLGFIFGIFVSFIVVFLFIKEILNSKKSKEKISLFSSENIYAFSAMLILVFIYSLDVIFAKGFFAAEVAGKYAVISMIGKIILFVVAAIGSVMFPINSEKFISNSKTSVVKKTFILSFLICATAIILFALFPEFIVKLLFGEQYTSMSGILIYIGIAFSFIALLNLILLYLISIDRFRFIHFLFLALFLVLQVVLLSVFHKTIEQFSLAFMYSSIISFLGGLILIKIK